LYGPYGPRPSSLLLSLQVELKHFLKVLAQCWLHITWNSPDSPLHFSTLMKAHKFGLRVVVFFQGIAKTKIWQLYHYLGKKEKEKSNDILNTISID